MKLASSQLYSIFVFYALAACAVASSILLFSGLSLRLDEAQSLWQTDRYPLGILRVVGADVHVPLYHILLHLWQLLFSNDVIAGRMMSLLFFVASIPLVIILGNRIYQSRAISFFAATLFTLSPFMNWYGNETRMYSMLVFFTLANQFFFLRLRRDNAAVSWLLYLLTAILGMYTHYYFGLVLFTQAIFFLIYRGSFSKGSLKRLIGCALAVALCILPWILYVYFLGQISNSEPLLTKPGLIDLFNTVSYYLFGQQSTSLNSFIVALWPLIMLGWFFSLQKKERASNLDSTYLFFSVLVPIGLAFLVSVLWHPIYEERYLIFTLPGFCLLIGAMIDSYPPVLSRIVKVVFICAMTCSLLIEALNPLTPINENYKGAAEYLSAHAVPQDVIVLSAPFTIYPIQYYFQKPVKIQTLPLWNPYVPGPIPAFDESTLASQVQEIAGDHERLWLLTSYDQGYEKTVRDYFDNHYQRLEVHTLSPGMSLELYQLRYDLNP